ncbi:MAG: hypothetical protein ACOYNV_19835, partial [Propionivibrio sp.]
PESPMPRRARLTLPNVPIHIIQPGRVRKFFSLRTRNPLAPTCSIHRVVRNASRFTPYQTARGRMVAMS